MIIFLNYLQIVKLILKTHNFTLHVLYCMLVLKHFSYIKPPNYNHRERFENLFLFFFECYCPLNHIDSVEGNRSASENQYLAHTYWSTSGQRSAPIASHRVAEQHASLPLRMDNLRVTVGAGSRVLRATKPQSRKTKVISLRYGQVSGWGKGENSFWYER